jgi:hypothetical protein
MAERVDYDGTGKDFPSLLNPVLGHQDIVQGGSVLCSYLDGLITLQYSCV